MVEVAISQHDDIGQAIEQALKLLDLEDLVSNRLVAVKPNDTWASRRDTTAVTQADALRATVRYLKRLGPRQLVVSGGAGAAETDEVFRITGMMEVVEQEQVEFFDHNRPPFERVELDYAPERGVDGPQREVMVNPRVLEYETLVSLAQLKVHRSATVTLSLKNIAMSYPAADYYGHPRERTLQPHRIFDDLQAFIAGMARRFPIHLAVIVGHPAMIGTGPIGGQTVECGLVIASRDPVAADVVGAHVLGVDGRQVPHLAHAGQLGVGQTDLQEIQFPGMTLEQAANLFRERASQQR